MWFKFLIFSFFLLFTGQISAQVDSLEYEEETDTVVIYKEPIIIKKNQPVQQVENLIGPWAVEVFVSPVYYANYFNVCKTCPNYLCKLNANTSPALSYSGGTNLVFIRKKIYANVGIAYTVIREKINLTDAVVDIQTKNKYNYLDINIAAGYVLQKNNFFVIFYAGGGLSKLVSTKGYTLAKTDTSVIELKKENNNMDYSHRINAGVNFMYKISEKLNLSIAPTYSGNTRTLIKKDWYYVQQRNLFGIKAGILYFL